MSKLYDLLNTLIGELNKSVKTKNQTLTKEQKTQARANINAASAETVTRLSEEIADYGTLTLGVHTDGLVYIFKNGQPVGVGVEVGVGGIDGYVDSANNIVLRGNYADGTLVKLEMADGTIIDIGEVVYVEESITNILSVYPVTYNQRWSASSGGFKSCVGMIFIKIPLTDVWGKTIRMKGFTADLKTGGQSPMWYIYNGDTQVGTGALESTMYSIWDNPAMSTDESGITSIKIDDDSFVSVNSGVPANGTHLYIHLAVVKDTNVSETDLADKIITINEPIS